MHHLDEHYRGEEQPERGDARQEPEDPLLGQLLAALRHLSPFFFLARFNYTLKLWDFKKKKKKRPETSVSGLYRNAVLVKPLLEDGFDLLAGTTDGILDLVELMENQRGHTHKH